jgi:hypothetical protein
MDYPVRAEQVAGKSLNDLRKDYGALYARMSQTDSMSAQQDAVRRCLNAGVTLNIGEASGPFCNEPGIEYLVYSGKQQDGAPKTLIGRVLSKVGLLKDPRSDQTTSYQDSYVLRDLLVGAEDGQVGYVARTVYGSGEGV